MPRAPRVHDPGSLWHLLSRGAHGRAIFDHEGDYQRFLSKLGECCAATDHRFYAYALMPNHFHFLLLAGQAPMAHLMQPLLSSHAHLLNARRETQGPVFQGRFRSIFCQREAHLLELVRYLHLNPVRAGLCNSPDDYPWSSHQAYLSGDARSWLLASEALQLFAATRPAALRQYRRFLEEGLKAGPRADLHAVLGVSKARPQLAPDTADRASAAIQAVCSALGVEEAEVRGSHRSPALSQARGLAAHFLIRSLKVPIAHAAELLGRARASIYHDLALGGALASSARFSRLLASLERGTARQKSLG